MIQHPAFVVIFDEENTEPAITMILDVNTTRNPTPSIEEWEGHLIIDNYPYVEYKGQVYKGWMGISSPLLFIKREEGMIYSRQRRKPADMEQAAANKRWFPVIGQDRKTHELILSYLAERCNPESWKVTLTCRNESPRRPYAIEDFIVSRKIEEDEYGISSIVADCRVSQELFHALAVYENFFQIENEGDISVYEGETCLLWTVGHHHDHWINPVFFQQCTELKDSEKALYADNRYFSDYPYCTSNAFAYGLVLENEEHFECVLQTLTKCGGTFSLARKKGSDEILESVLSPWRVLENETETIYQNRPESITRLLEFAEAKTRRITFLKEGLALAYTLPEKNIIVLEVFELLVSYMIILDPIDRWAV